MLKTQRKKNRKRVDNNENNKKKTQMSKRIEVTISNIKTMFARKTHTVILAFFLKAIVYIFVNKPNKQYKTAG